LASSMAVRELMRTNGSDNAFWGRQLYGELRQRGLCELRAEGRVLMCDRRNAGADLQRVNFDQLGPQLIARQLITADQLAADRARLDSEAYVQPSPVMWTVAGRCQGSEEVRRKPSDLKYEEA
jgi:hypothetical protein